MIIQSFSLAAILNRSKVHAAAKKAALFYYQTLPDKSVCFDTRDVVKTRQSKA